MLMLKNQPQTMALAVVLTMALAVALTMALAVVLYLAGVSKSLLVGYYWVEVGPWLDVEKPLEEKLAQHPKNLVMVS